MGFLDKVKGWFESGKPAPKGDLQDQAFENVEPFTDDDLQRALDKGELEIWPQDLIKSPEEYEAEHWDAGRTRAKTLVEAHDENAEAL